MLLNKRLINEVIGKHDSGVLEAVTQGQCYRIRNTNLYDRHFIMQELEWNHKEYGWNYGIVHRTIIIITKAGVPLIEDLSF